MTVVLDLTPVGAAAGTCAWECGLPTGWNQGRGVWGGLVIEAIVRAAEETVSSLNLAAGSVRSINGVMAGPWLPGKGRVTARVVRAGSSVTTISVDVINAGGDDTGEDVAASALVVIAADRPSAADVDGPTWQHVADPAVKEALDRGPATYEAMDLTGLGPEFFAHLEIRPVAGFPGANDPHVVTMGWTRFKQDVDATAAWLAACTDMWWPAAMTGTNPMRPFATVTFEIMLLVDPNAEPALNANEPLLHVGRNLGARGGYVTETAELWTVDGRLATTATQLIAVIK